MKSYKHLSQSNVTKFDYSSKMMQKAMPSRAFYNTLTSNIILSVQAILAKSFKAVSYITTYKSF